MIAYNVTAKVDKEIVDDWYKWMVEEHIPDVMKTGFFKDFRVFRLLGQDNSDGFTFVIQYLAATIDDYNTYNQTEAPRLQKDHVDRYGEKVLAFRTIMEML